MTSAREPSRHHASTEALIDEVAPGIHRIPVPTPFAIGSINCYLLSGEPLTLIDTGPNAGTSLDHLERALAAIGVRAEDLDLIVLTHQHLDHEGLLEILVRRSGADVAAFAPLGPWLTDFRASSKAEDAYAQATMTRHGLPDNVNSMLGVVASLVRGYGSDGTVTRPLYDGDTITMGGRDYSVHHRPGHSPSDLVFFDAARGILVGGDHLLARITSTALVSRPLDGNTDGPRPMPLLDYAKSLRATGAMPVSLLLSGHGEVITDHVELIETRLREQERRAGKILSLIADEPLTAHAITQRIWGETATTKAYITLSGVLGHLDMLLVDGRATETEVGGVSLFRAS